MYRRFEYPASFIGKVKEAFPENTDIHAQLDNGGRFSVELFLQESDRKDLFAELQALLLEQ